MSHKSGHIIIRRLTAPMFYEDTTPAEGVGKYAAKIKVWHALALSFLVGLPL